MIKMASCALAVIVFVTSVSADEADRPSGRDRRLRGNQPQGGGRDISAMFRRFDINNDGTLEAREIPPPLRQRIQQIDLNKDGKLTLDEVRNARGRAGAGSSEKRGEVITGPARGERHRASLKVGDAAPDFTLSDPDEKGQIRLSSFRGKRPVVLIFGSYT